MFPLRRNSAEHKFPDLPIFRRLRIDRLRRKTVMPPEVWHKCAILCPLLEHKRKSSRRTDKHARKLPHIPAKDVQRKSFIVGIAPYVHVRRMNIEVHLGKIPGRLKFAIDTAIRQIDSSQTNIGRFRLTNKSVHGDPLPIGKGFTALPVIRRC